MRPRIGITTSYDDGTQSLDRRYVTAVEAAGGLPLPLPMLDTEAAYADGLSSLDGLVVTGGPAVTTGMEGTLPDELDAPSSVRAASDRQWVRRCQDTDRPILGICYGMQLLNALAGGTIYGDVETQHDGALSHSHKRGGTTHPVSLERGSQLRGWLETDTLTANTRHLQAVARIGDGFEVSARAPDGVVEAIEHRSAWRVGVQFHPERMGDVTAPLFEALIDAARAHAATPSR